MNVLPGLKSCINAQLVAVAKEYAAYGDVVESKVYLSCLLCVVQQNSIVRKESSY